MSLVAFSFQKLCHIVLIIGSLVLSGVRGGYKTVCYYESWAVYRRVDAKLGADFTLSPPPCTHLIYAFALIKEGVIEPFDALVDLDGDGQYGGYQKFNLITKSAKPVTTLLAVGGWNAGSQAFSDMAMDPDTREEFGKQAVTYLRRHGFQGLDIDWEYPADREGSRPEDRENFSLLLQDTRAAFDAEVLAPGNKRLLLTVALSPHPDKTEKSYDLATIGQYVDFVNLMTYDYARAGWSMEMKPHNPLWKRPEDTPWQSQLNAEWAVQTMIKGGIAPEKLILGIPTYGATYKINPKIAPKIHGSHLGGGDAGPITKEKGYLAYSEICRRMKLESGWTISMDQSGVPVCYRNSEWMSYESPKSARNKALFAMRYKLGGAMVWSLATDDFNGFCDGKKYGLTQILRDTFDASSKMMGRGEQYGTSSQSDASDVVAQYCLSDAKGGSGGDCQVKVFCPEMTRSFLPYELSCVQTLGKCSYPRVQICDVPKLAKGSKPKYRLYLDSTRPANVTCTSGLTVKPAIDVVTVKDKCKKQSLSCTGNQLGGYNIVNYICPAGSEFDTTLKVCKIPDTLDPDDDPCADQPSSPVKSSSSAVTVSHANDKPRTQLQRPGYQAQSVPGLNQQLDYFHFPKQQDFDAIFDKPVPTATPALAPEIADPQTQVGNDGQSSQVEQQQVESDNNEDDTVGKPFQPPVTAAPIPPTNPPVASPQKPLFRNRPKFVPTPSRARPKAAPPANALKFPDDFPSPSQQSVLLPFQVPKRTFSSRPVKAPPVSQTSSPEDTGRRNPTALQKPVCSPIGARIPNPKKPCSASFLVCMTPFTVLELKCARGLIYDGTLHFCLPPNLSVRCKQA
ncbi:Chitotriosidase-1 [Hypsibius exemplaris]|uniref:Chitotriosidase-1 n=1 Tax=Hypsibius exemplaris TaxID=2072580 RepID=A0A9X6NJA0_HYPEX|nr:Chitotriosidase-1 [Hypsibius exemplaris]